jgi:hypothetical protein
VNEASDYRKTACILYQNKRLDEGDSAIAKLNENLEKRNEIGKQANICYDYLQTVILEKI